MDDSDSGGLVSTEEEQSGESSGSTGQRHMEKKISKLKLKLKGFEKVGQLCQDMCIKNGCHF